ncbi:MAG: carbohydrate ABC transporter permease [Azospirillaceae bacterium]
MTRARRNRIVALTVLGIATAITVYPIVWMTMASLRVGPDVFGQSLFSTAGLGIGNYVSALAARPFLLYLLNSVLASGISVAVTVVVGCLAGYSFAKFRYRGAGVFWLVVLASIMIPQETIVIPLFLQVHAFGWTNTYAGLILPTAFNVVGVFIFRQAIRGVPDDFIEAARIDGASEPRILFSVVLPMIAPTLVVVAVLTFNLTWNSYLWPLIVVSDDQLRTLPLGMAAFQRSFNTQYGQVMAVSVLGTVPTLLFFLSLQRYFLESAVAAGIKG